MSFHKGEIEVQQRAGVRDIAKDVGEGIIDFVPPDAADFLSHRQMAVLGTVDRSEGVWASVVTGEPGFIELVDPRTISIRTHPSSSDPLFGNLASGGHIAMFAPDFVAARRVRVNGSGEIKDGKLYVRTREVYANCRRYMQERMIAGEREVPPGARVAVKATALSNAQQQQISVADTFFIATDHPDRGADVSHKGGNPGFVKVIDDRRLAFPDYNGNSMFNTLGNLTINPHAGLLFIDFDTGRTLQLSGVASIDWKPDRARTFAGAERVVDFELRQIIDTPIGFPLIARFRQFSRYNPKS